MAVYCAICGTRILSRMENYGTFEVNKSFFSRDPYAKKNNMITDSCVDCGSTIDNEIAEAKAQVAKLTLQAISKIRNQ